MADVLEKGKKALSGYFDPFIKTATKFGITDGKWDCKEVPTSSDRVQLSNKEIQLHHIQYIYENIIAHGKKPKAPFIGDSCILNIRFTEPTLFRKAMIREVSFCYIGKFLGGEHVYRLRNAKDRDELVNGKLKPLTDLLKKYGAEITHSELGGVNGRPDYVFRIEWRLRPFIPGEMAPANSKSEEEVRNLFKQQVIDEILKDTFYMAEMDLAVVEKIQ